MIVPYNSKLLKTANSSSTSAKASPFVVAIEIAGIKVLPGFLNGCILLFVFSAANSELYIGTRTIYGLAMEGLAPAFLQRTNKSGVPIYCVLCCTTSACIDFLNVSTSSATVFTYFTNLVTVFGMLVWLALLITHVFFVRARHAQGVADNELRYKAPLGIWGSYFGIFAIVIVILIKNFSVFVHSDVAGGIYGNFDYKSFIIKYLSIIN
jgi:amino acid transporter